MYWHGVLVQHVKKNLPSFALVITYYHEIMKMDSKNAENHKSLQKLSESNVLLINLCSCKFIAPCVMGIKLINFLKSSVSHKRYVLGANGKKKKGNILSLYPRGPGQRDFLQIIKFRGLQVLMMNKLT